MAKVHVCNVIVLDNPSPFLNPFQFEITFECIEDLPEDLEWKITYVGSAESEEFDQTLDTVYVGPVPEGRHMFVFQADPPNPAKIPEADLVGVTVVLLTCSYRSAEFIRVGYYVNNEYPDSEMNENPPSPPIYDQLFRNIMACNPRVTKFKINWDLPTISSSQENTEKAESVVNAENAENVPPRRIFRHYNSPVRDRPGNTNSPVQNCVKNAGSTENTVPAPTFYNNTTNGNALQDLNTEM